MFSNEIKFISNKEFLSVTDVLPKPTKLNIPKWYKELNHTTANKTIKGCMPFLDTLTTGYIIKMPVDYHIEHNKKKDEKRYTVGYTKLFKNSCSITTNTNVNVANSTESHSINQLGEKCPFVKKNKNLAFHKLLNPWIIKTPPGYSCLFLPPMNNGDDRFSIIPGIVDTDTYPSEVNFPIIINGDKYPILDTIIESGTPIVQVIPFKREKWKMTIEAESKEDKNKRTFLQGRKIFNVYKNKWWYKKSWK